MKALTRCSGNVEAIGSLLRRYVKFCVVGGTGMAMDMTVLYFLAHPAWFGWNLTLAKFCSAETAMLNNFIWNELWTFRQGHLDPHCLAGVWGRLLRFHGICGVGIVLAVVLLHLFHGIFGLNLYVANLLAIALVTVWNFGMNARFNWRGGGL